MSVEAPEKVLYVSEVAFYCSPKGTSAEHATAVCDVGDCIKVWDERLIL